ncbi:lysophospholipid acyltransferase family protein [Mucilaginibacter sp.]|uniref:lysophospholipid acyltransferase family protein n=1 Tax=Mucilaginibacter sp. TaxID=1882438 RepID=UPI0035BBBB76
MSIISRADVIAATGTVHFPAVASLLMRVMKIDAFNQMMRSAEALEGVAFTQYALNYLGINIEIDPAGIANIPADGAFIAVANHPYGAVESLALLSLLVTKRPDTLFMGNFLLKRVPHLAQYIIGVNPFESLKDSSSISGLKTTLQKLKSGTPVAIFPAGEVSAYDFKTQSVTDKQWHPVVGKLIAKANVPVLPIYFHGSNGLVFSLLRYIHPSLQTAMLPAELFNKKGMTLRISIGKPFYPDAVCTEKNQGDILSFTREQTYSLKEKHN